MVDITMCDPFRYVSYVPADAGLGRGVQFVLGRPMIPVAAGATPEEAAQFADDLANVMVFDSATGRFVFGTSRRRSRPSRDVH
jgi:hypothetical protein